MSAQGGCLRRTSFVRLLRPTRVPRRFGRWRSEDFRAEIPNQPSATDWIQAAFGGVANDPAGSLTTHGQDVGRNAVETIGDRLLRDVRIEQVVFRLRLTKRPERCRETLVSQVWVSPSKFVTNLQRQRPNNARAVSSVTHGSRIAWLERPPGIPTGVAAG
jgi:hypothetical protein